MPQSGQDQNQLIQQLAGKALALPEPAPLPAGLAGSSQTAGSPGALWLPNASPPATSRARGGQLGSGMRASTYLTASDVFGRAVPVTELAQRLSQVSAADVLAHVARLLAEVERHTEPAESVDRRWAAQLFAGGVRVRVEDRLSQGARLLAPQLLLGAAKLALLAGGPGPPQDPPQGVEEATFAMLGLADYLGAGVDEQGRQWGGMPAGLALELVSNQHFNHADPPGTLIGRFQRMWRELGAAAARERGLPAPTDLYAEAVGADWGDAAGLVAAMHAQAVLHGFVRFPRSFFQAAGLVTEAVEKVLSALSRPQEQLREAVWKEVERSGFDWGFNAMRRFPLVELADGTLLVPSLRFLIERVFGVPFYWEIVNHLDSKGTRRDVQRFDTVHAEAVEAYAVETAQSIAPSLPGGQRVYVEREMQRAWKSRRETPSVCDLVVDYGEAWLCVEVISSRLSEAATTGTSLDALEQDLRKFVTTRKARQLASTIRLLKRRERDLTGRPAPAHRGYVPVLLAGHGFPVNPATLGRARELLQEMDLLQPPILPMVVISTTELELVEALAQDHGQSAARLILNWAASSARDAPLDNYLAGQGLPLVRPRRLTALFEGITGQLIERQEAGLIG